MTEIIKYDLSRRFYRVVPASTQLQDNYVPANGEKLLLVVLGGDSSSSPDTRVCISWDPDGTPNVIFSTYGASKHENVLHEVTGDGVKKLQICLTNDLTEEVILGGYWQGDQI